MIGRDPTSGLELADDSVSRNHAMLECVDGEFVLSDLGSTNGTYVNDQRIDSRRLNPGDRLRFGNQIFKFLSADRIEAEYHETVYDIMTTDGLTQVHSKRYLMEVVERRAAPHAADSPAAVGVDDRRRSIQGHQRHVRPSDGRRSADRALPPAQHANSGATKSWPDTAARNSRW